MLIQWDCYSGFLNLFQFHDFYLISLNVHFCIKLETIFSFGLCKVLFIIVVSSTVRRRQSISITVESLKIYIERFNLVKIQVGTAQISQYSI